MVRRQSRNTRSFTDYRDFHLNDDTLCDGPDGANFSNTDADESDYEDLDFPWEEESTLFSDLMDEEYAFPPIFLAHIVGRNSFNTVQKHLLTIKSSLLLARCRTLST